MRSTSSRMELGSRISRWISLANFGEGLMARTSGWIDREFDPRPDWAHCPEYIPNSAQRASQATSRLTIATAPAPSPAAARADPSLIVPVGRSDVVHVLRLAAPLGCDLLRLRLAVALPFALAGGVSTDCR